MPPGNAELQLGIMLDEGRIKARIPAFSLECKNWRSTPNSYMRHASGGGGMGLGYLIACIFIPFLLFCAELELGVPGDRTGLLD
ncbi:hypothetical protein [Desulfogranum marinum]|uniref:hypothetical protein n=1 Tax=Desulfogranum marinum TaxID=453220 RepID=UPI0019651899|nr:hypothetical protein [Desulfogranum marinum]MBM9512105.1 hypothetical protein [Desulfogranum marinum]